MFEGTSEKNTTRVSGALLSAFAVLLMAFLLSFDVGAEESESITLWHSYRGAERKALDLIVSEWNVSHRDMQVEPLAVPYDAYANKITSAIPRGNGPDLFIAAHERIGDWSRSGLLRALSDADIVSAVIKDYFPQTLDALKYNGKLYGLPLAFKSASLFVNTALIDDAPETTAQLLAFCETYKNIHPDDFCLAYEAGSFYHHAGWLYGFGGGIFDEDGRINIKRPENARSMAFVADMTGRGFIPEEPTAALVARLFNEGRTPLVLNGPWFMGEIDSSIDYKVAPLPMVAETGRRATPFLTVEGVLFSSYSENTASALEFARFLAGRGGAGRRAIEGRQAVAYAPVYDDPGITIDPHILSFKHQVGNTVPMPNDPLMRAVWEPAAQALRKVLRGAVKADEALKGAEHQLKIVTRPAPERSNPAAYLLILAASALLAILLVWRKTARDNLLRDIAGGWRAYAYLAPAVIAMFLLVFIPFAVGTAVSLFAHRSGEFTFVGLSNFWNIITSADYEISDPLSFYFTLGVTVMWTAINVFLHVSVGLALALILRDPWLRLNGVYRVLLIVPWAVPNYITALIWKGMFHKQFGAINGLLVWLGLEPISWFSQFWTSFAANVATNTWLGFPFMMVVTLGALQAIPRELEEAAEVDGAGKFQRFVTVTLPLIRPALLPAVILGSVWTFNMFNIIYLVSGGEPDGATEILISEAYRWAFTRQEQYGYAAAYATLIFAVLLIYSLGTRRLVREA